MDLQQLRSGIFEVYEPLENERQYVLFDAERGNLLVDVPPYGERALRVIRGAGRAALLLVTNAGRAADAHRYREALGLQVVAHSADASAVQGGADVVLGDDVLLRPDVRAIRVGGATVLLVAKDGGVLFCGDLDLASESAKPLTSRSFTAVLSARRPPVWNAGRDDLMRLQGELPQPRKRFGVLLPAPWDRAYRGRLESLVTPNPLIPTDRTVADAAAMGPKTLVAAREARDLVERPPRPAWPATAAAAPSAAPARAAGKARPRSFEEDWAAPASPAPALTLANDARDIQPSRASAAPAAGGAAVDAAGGIDLSADGREVVFAAETAGSLEICAAPLEGDRVFQLTGAGARSTSPRWSPDLGTVAFLRGPADRAALWLVDRSGVAEHELAAGPVVDLAWSPDGRTIAAGSPRGLRAVDVASGTDRALTDGDDRSPAWSPDGAQVAFVRGAAGARALYLVPVAGGTAVRLETGGEAFDPAWSPDGRRIACTILAGGRRRIAVLTLAGASVASVSLPGSVPFETFAPRWRADGRGLVYLEERGSGTVLVRRILLASAVDTPAADRPGVHASPRLGPDSESLVYLLGNELWWHPKRAVEPRRLR